MPKILELEDDREEKLQLKKKITKVKTESENCKKSELVHDVKKIKKDIGEVLVNIKEESKVIQTEIESLKEVVDKILEIVVEIRYKVAKFHIYKLLDYFHDNFRMD